MPGRSLNDTERRLHNYWGSNAGPSLRSLELTGTGLRGLRNVVVDFRYPLTVIAGKNGVGKSTILACAACAYQNRQAFRTLFSQKQYFNFNDFFISGWGDSPIQDVTVKWTYRKADRTIEIVEVKKPATRWNGYRKRIDHPSDFIGTLRAVHPVEFRILRNRFGTTAVVQASQLAEEQRSMVSQVVGREYANVQVGESGKHRLHRLQSGQTEYSAFNAGSGEDIGCVLIRAINHLPRFGLLIVEEIETGLHASAQRRLAQKILEVCLDRLVQVICSTHSSDFLAAVPSEARVLLCRTQDGLEVRHEVTVEEATSDLVESPVTELVVCVEDRVARSLALELLPSQLRTRVRVIRCGSWEDVLRQMASYCRDAALGNVVGILDGDRRNERAEHERSFATFVGGQISTEQQTWLNDRIRFLPDSVPPEQWFWQVGQQSQDYRRELSQQLNSDQNAVDGFFKGAAPADFHNVPFELSRRLGIEEERAITGLCAAAVRNQAAALQDVLDFVRERLNVA